MPKEKSVKFVIENLSSMILMLNMPMRLNRKIF